MATDNFFLVFNFDILLNITQNIVEIGVRLFIFLIHSIFGVVNILIIVIVIILWTILSLALCHVLAMVVLNSCNSGLSDFLLELEQESLVLPDDLPQPEEGVDDATAYLTHVVGIQRTVAEKAT